MTVSANTTYVASYHTDVGHYASDAGYFANGVDNTPLHALASGVDGPNGVYAYGTSAFPTSSYQNSNYWVDVVFAPSGRHDPADRGVNVACVRCGQRGDRVERHRDVQRAGATIHGHSHAARCPGGAVVAARRPATTRALRPKR